MAIYDTHFFNAMHSGSLMSARVVVPRLVRLLHAESIVDVGCGTGLWLAEFLKNGVQDVLGIDGSWVPEPRLCVPTESFLRHDLTEPLPLARWFDLVLCLEVAQHLPRSVAEQFVATLTALGSIILFSAATPGQGGYGHVNEQPHQWWDRLFAERGYRPCRGFGSRFAREPNVVWWYSHNMVFYVRHDAKVEADLEMRHLDGPPREVALDRIAPVVMTCARNVPLVEQFVTSYEQRIGKALSNPLISVDLTASHKLPAPYLSLLSRLSPLEVAVHPRALGVSNFESINDAAFFALARGLEEMGDCDYLLFIEDDVKFSTQFIPFLSRLQVERDTGLYSLYRPGGRQKTAVVEPRHFFGTQCALFPKRGVEEILRNREDSRRRFSLTYDQQWARSLELGCYQIYRSPESYVQHLGAASRYGSAPHSSHTFVE